MNLGHTVDGVGAHDAQVSHVDPLLAALFNQGHAGHAVIISRELGCDSLQNFSFFVKTAKMPLSLPQFTTKDATKILEQRL